MIEKIDIDKLCAYEKSLHIKQLITIDMSILLMFDFDDMIKLCNEHDLYYHNTYIVYNINQLIVLRQTLQTTTINFDDDDIVNIAIYAIELLLKYHAIEN